MPSVSVIIPTWNKAELVASALRNLGKQTCQPTEIIVVDNGSADNTSEVAVSAGARLIRLETNAGFAAAVNAGIRSARSEWLFILNNDVELDPEWLRRALDAAATESAGFVTGKLLQAKHPERLDGTWDLLARSGCAWRCGWNSVDGLAWHGRRKIQIASLTATIFRRSVFEKAGVLDEIYGSYYEDVDFGLRCSLAGFSGIYEPTAIGWHLGSATLGQRNPQMTYLVSRNQILLAAKFGLTKISKWSFFIGQLVTLIPALRCGNLLAALRGKWAGIRAAPGLPGRQPATPRLREFLAQNEKELFEFQRKLGFDLSWRIYFALTRR